MKIHSRHLHAPLCGISAPNSGYIARCVPFIRDKFPTNSDEHLAVSNFKTRNSPQPTEKFQGEGRIAVKPFENKSLPFFFVPVI
ncbi:DUF6783 domain-containing protein [uncultured Robinsoniella sp.]|uniref:DUF6783 domain-containing protein n=1 Tax=uncultured Robinsoniella sp. TaxID=904190 RepID=UPI00374E2D5E